MSPAPCVRQEGARQPEDVRLKDLVVEGACCRGGCVEPTLAEHHDRLLAVETDGDELLELFELAVTWGELDYSREALVPPQHWLDFALRHRWRDPDRMLRIFSLATDIASRSVRGDAGAVTPLGPDRVFAAVG